MCKCFYTLAKIISISNMSVLHQCQFDELSSGVGSPCQPATLWQTCTCYIGKCHLPFLQSKLLKKCRLSHRLSFLQNPFAKKRNRVLISILPFPTNSARLLLPHGEAGWCWCERIVNIFSFTPSGATRPCAALIILHSFLSLYPPSV